MNIKEHPTWHIKDSSKLDTFMRCKRRYFYEYLLGWRLNYPNHDLYFGQAWHLAREYQLLHGYDDIEGAYNEFITYYREQFAPEDDEINKPKTPVAVLHALMKFNEERQGDLTENEVVEIDGTKMTEVSGTVPVDENRILYYRMDSVMRRKEDGMIFSMDHKTTSGKWIHYTKYDQEHFLSLQNGTYTHCLYCMFPVEQVLGVQFDKVGFEFLPRGSKSRAAGYHATIRTVPAYKTPEQMNSWLWLVNILLDDLEYEMDGLSHCKENDQVLMSFPMNPSSCTDFGGCPFHDYCLAWQNPLQHAYEPPIGFKVDRWDPSKMQTTVKKDLKWKGDN